MNFNFLTPLTYFSSTLLILLWWTLAFPPPLPQTSSKATATQLDSLGPHLHRPTLHKALSGDFEQMAELIKMWDAESILLEQKGIKDVYRLDPILLQKSKELLEHLQDKQTAETWNKALSKGSVYDDLGASIDCQAPNARFLPQTHMAASFLMALLAPEQITALPTGLRQQEKLYPFELTEKIPLDLQHLSQERLFITSPDVAFIANYSNPATVSALKAQGIPLFTVKNIHSIENIQNVLLRIGHVVHKPCEAQLLHIFIDAALYAIDNRLQQLKREQHISKWPCRLLYLSYYGHFSRPAPNSLTGRLLERLERITRCLPSTPLNQKNQWIASISSEKIVDFQPDGIIIALSGGENKRRELSHMLRGSCLTTICDAKHLYLIDDDIQQSPSQYLVLAYFDLAMAIQMILKQDSHI